MVQSLETHAYVMQNLAPSGATNIYNGLGGHGLMFLKEVNVLAVGRGILLLETSAVLGVSKPTKRESKVITIP